MSENKIYPVPASVASNSHIDKEKYDSMYQESINDTEGFWAKQAEEFVTWNKKWDNVLDWDYHKGHIRWFEGASLNVSYNCIDRHLEKRGDQTAIIWEGDDPNDDQHISYKQLHQEVCKLSNVLKARGVKKVIVYVYTCRWFLKRLMRCWHAHGLVQYIPLCLVAFLLIHYATVFLIQIAKLLLQQMRECVVGKSAT